MRMYGTQDVFDAALDRIRFLFDEFEEIIVWVSGGKDSTVILHLSLIVAREKNRLPLKVGWIDQEVEWQSTVDMVEEIMQMPEVDPYWFQMPMVITNNASTASEYNHCWNEKKKELWTHEKDPNSIHVNKYGEQRFKALFAAIMQGEFGDKKACGLGGVRSEESPQRTLTLTTDCTYKWITWGKHENRGKHYTFYPIYDWSYRDIWKAILDNHWSYNRVYDAMYRHGVLPNKMRVSNLHHETALQSLLLLQEIEPATWEKVSKRIPGANTVKHMKKDAFSTVSDLPSMFTDWEDYAMHLAKNLIHDQVHYDRLMKEIRRGKKTYAHEVVRNAYFKKIVKVILCSDWDLTAIVNFNAAGDARSYRNWRSGKWSDATFASAKYIPKDELKRIKEVLARREKE